MPGFGEVVVKELAHAYGAKAFRSLATAANNPIKNALSVGLEERTVQMGGMLIENGTKLLGTAQQTVQFGAEMMRLGINLTLENATLARQGLVTQLGTKRAQLVTLQNEVNQQLNHFNQTLKQQIISTRDLSQQKLQEFTQSEIGKKIQSQGVNAAYEAGKLSYETAVGTGMNMIDLPTKAGDAATFSDVVHGNSRSAVSGVLATLIATELQRRGFKKLDVPVKSTTSMVFNNFTKKCAQFSLPEKVDYHAVAASALLAAASTVLNQTKVKSDSFDAHVTPITMSFDKAKELQKSHAEVSINDIKKNENRPKM